MKLAPFAVQCLVSLVFRLLAYSLTIHYRIVTIDYRIVKNLVNLANSRQFAKVFSTNIHDEARDHTICVTECTRMLNLCSYKVPYE